MNIPCEGTWTDKEVVEAVNLTTLLDTTAYAPAMEAVPLLMFVLKSSIAIYNRFSSY
jgi:hypothetical protein